MFTSALIKKTWAIRREAAARFGVGVMSIVWRECLAMAKAATKAVVALALALAAKSSRAVSGYNPRAVAARAEAGLSAGDKLVLGSQTITYLGEGMARAEKNGKVIREGRMSETELSNLLAAIAANA